MVITQEIIRETVLKLNKKAATDLPKDVERRLEQFSKDETHKLSKFVFQSIIENITVAREEERPFCADTGLPRYFIKIGNEAEIENGIIGLEAVLRDTTKLSTHLIPLRPNRVHPISRHDNNNNVGAHAPSINYTFEPNASWIDVTAVHKGGLFGSDYRMLFPSDGIKGIKRFFIDTISEFFYRGLSCQPVIVGIGLGGTKDDCFRIGMEASLLRIIGSSNPDPEIAQLEEELIVLGNSIGFGPMGYPGKNTIMDVHIEIAYAHTGGLPVSIHHLCYAARRATARIYDNNRVELRDDPEWFTTYYRREN